MQWVSLIVGQDAILRAGCQPAQFAPIADRRAGLTHYRTPFSQATRLIAWRALVVRCLRMGIHKPVAGTVLLLFSAALAYAADKRDWKEGRLVSTEAVEHRYQCVVSDIVYSYTVEYQDPIKAVVHGRVQFAIEKDQFILLDTDGKERWGRIEKRERVLLDSPDRPRRLP